MQLNIITYDSPHLKTEQVLARLILRHCFQISLYALPFMPRKKREVLFAHRPDMAKAAHPAELAKHYNLSYHTCKSDTDIPSNESPYLLLGAGLLSAECVADKNIINCHSGLIPTSRGLDSFKWAILKRYPVGLTLHYIDDHIDAGKIISTMHTPIFPTDSLESFARRHYENEINTLCRFDYYLKHPHFVKEQLEEMPPTMRVPRKKEQDIFHKFEDYRDYFSS